MTDNGDIRVEIVPPPGYAGDLGPSDLVDKFGDRVGELGEALAGIASRLRESLASQLDEPSEGGWQLSEASLQFSLNLESEVGVIISRAKAGSTFQASLTWSRRDNAVG
ncbi:CU044_2847 family protein [Nocardia sp. NPDC050713]|uniref:CU044_2847 family protein n=1 Tax=Nocardia sp. NPDC050713 TaxID=3154511 RepID=UPI0033C65748